MATKSNESSRVKQLIAGVNQHMSGVTSVTIDNVPYAMSAFTELLTSFANLFDGAQAAKATYQDKLKAQRTQAPALRVIVAAFVTYVRASFGNSPQVLNDFGLTPYKAKAPLTAEQTVDAVDKRLATRAARHTMGKRQKLAVTGQTAKPAQGEPSQPAQVLATSAPATANGSQVHGPGS